jgi:hypothetical protein
VQVVGREKSGKICAGKIRELFNGKRVGNYLVEKTSEKYKYGKLFSENIGKKE